MVTNYRKALVCAGMSFVLAASALQGCGGSKDSGSTTGADSSQTSQAQASEQEEDLLSSMKEFSTPDGSASIHLDSSWTTEDMGVDFWMGVQSKDGAEGVILMQFPKDGALLPADSMDTVKSTINEGYGITETTAAEAPSIPGMTNVEAVTCSITAEGETAETLIIYGETDYAYYGIMYVADKINDKIMSSVAASCSTFREEPIEAEDNTTVELSDTVRWFNASYAILTEVNGWDYNRFAGLPANEQTQALEQQSLDEWWGVTDRASADETLDWILTEGHRADFAETMELLEGEGFGGISADERISYVKENFGVEDAEAEFLASSYELYEKSGKDAIAGWDYCRAMNLLSFYYLAGYYTETEALDKSLEIAQTIQPLFESWDELVESYMGGYEYWANESSDERREIYEDLKSRDDNPYAIDFKMTLEKTW